MPTHLLTVRYVHSLKPARTRYEVFDTTLRGFGIRVSEDGHKSWIFLYRMLNGPLRRLTIGTAPPLTLKAARKEARDAWALVQTGVDPGRVKRLARQAETFAELAASYLDLHATKKKKSWKEDRRIITNDLLPVWQHVKLAALTRGDVRALLEKRAQTAPVMANRLLALISRMLNFALERDWITTNPAQRITRPGAEVSRDRVLTDDEIRAVWAVLEGESEDGPIINRRVAAAFKLRLMTAQRGAEVIRLRWPDLDLAAGWWTIPAEMTKNGEQHRVPLSKPAVALLSALRATAASAAVYVFPALRRRKDHAERPAVDLHKKMGVALTKALGGTIRPHDLRRTAATRMAAAGVARISISYLLNHVDGGPRSTLVYDRFERDPEKRTAMETWARSLTAILEKKVEPGRVLPMWSGR